MHDSIQQSPADARQYRRADLPNGMRILLVHDDSTERAAAALNVHVGHFADDDDLPGLAHFLEHMVFLGSTKYPNENEYAEYLARNGGHSNASTSSEDTTFFFEVKNEALEGALDRFAQFFISPLLDESCTERELNAVNSEHQNNLQSDSWRLQQIDRHESSKGHYYHKFSTGNLQTLLEIPSARNINVRQRLLDFHRRFYSANMMTLVIVSQHTLDDVEKLAHALFSKVPSFDVRLPQSPFHPITKEYAQQRIEVIPVKDMHVVNVCWAIPDMEEYYRIKPQHYVAHLLGHEGHGSIYADLKAKGLATSLTSGYKHGGKGFGFMTVTVELSPQGFEEQDAVVREIFSYVRLLQASDVKEWIFRERQTLSEIGFRFLEKQRSGRYAFSLSREIQHYPDDLILSGPHLFFDYDVDVIRSTVDLLKTDNFRLIVVSSNFKADSSSWLQEPYYGVNYRTQSLSRDYLSLLESAGDFPLALPQPNVFVPTKLDLKDQGKITSTNSNPVMIRETPLVRLWFKQDDEFKVPKANISLLLRSPMAYASPLYAMCTEFLVELLIDVLNEYAYDAEVAGLGYSLKNVIQGLEIFVDGFDDKLPVLLARILTDMKGLVVLPDRFALIRDKLQRFHANFKMNVPARLTQFHLTLLVQERLWTYSEKLEALEHISVGMLQQFITEFCSRLHMEMFVHGNFTYHESIGLCDSCERILGASPLSESEMQPLRSISFPKGVSVLYQHEVLNPEQAESAVQVMFPVTLYSESVRLRCLVDLLAQISNESFFNQLRTKEQLGYIVACNIMRNSDLVGLQFLVQSHQDPLFVHGRVESFLHEVLRPLLRSMGEAEFQSYVQGVVNLKLEKDKNLSQQSARYWAHIVSGTYDFDRLEDEVNELRTIAPRELLDFLDDHILDRRKRCKVVVGFVSQKKIKSPAELLEGTNDPKTARLPGSKSETLAGVDSDSEEVWFRVPPKGIIAFKSQRPLNPGATPSSKYYRLQVVKLDSLL